MKWTSVKLCLIFIWICKSGSSFNSGSSYNNTINLLQNFPDYKGLYSRVKLPLKPKLNKFGAPSQNHKHCFEIYTSKSLQPTLSVSLCSTTVATIRSFEGSLTLLWTGGGCYFLQILCSFRMWCLDISTGIFLTRCDYGNNI